MLLLVGVLLSGRGKHQFLLYKESLFADENWSAFVVMCESCCAAILNYQQGWAVGETFSTVHARFNKASAAAGDYSTLTIWLLKASFNLIVSLTTVIGAYSVLDGSLKVGGFVVLVNAVKGFGGTLVSVANILNTMVTGSAAVRKVADILNMDTRRRVRYRRERDGLPGYAWSIDAKDIALKDICYGYPSSQVLAVPQMRLDIPSGGLVCFGRGEMNKSPNGPVGINTLFKLIVRDLFPGSGVMTYPSRWSVICVPVVPLLLDATLMYNIAYARNGVPSEVVWKVCEDLGLSKSLLGNDDFDVGTDGTNLKHSDKAIVALARALIADKDMICLQGGIDVLGQDHGVRVLRYLKEYIKNRGVPMYYGTQQAHLKEYEPKQIPHDLRHPKTVLFPSKVAGLQQEAEIQVCIDDGDNSDTNHHSSSDGTISSIAPDRVTSLENSVEMINKRTYGLEASVQHILAQLGTDTGGSGTEDTFPVVPCTYPSPTMQPWPRAAQGG